MKAITVKELMDMLAKRDPNMKVVVSKTQSTLQEGPFGDEHWIDSWDELEDIDEPYETSREVVTYNDKKEKVVVKEAVLLIS